MQELKVSAKSKPNAVAGAITAIIRDGDKAVLEVVGAGALNQAIKAIAITRGYIAPSGKDVVCIPAFYNIEIDGEEKTGIKLTVVDRDE